MIFLSSKVFFSFGITMSLMVTHFVSPVPIPAQKRSTANNDSSKSGFSTVPKVLEIQLPLKIVSKDDLVAWARYVMTLMSSRINITFSTIKDGNNPVPEVVSNSYSEIIAPQPVPRSSSENERNLAVSNIPGKIQAYNGINGPQGTFLKNPEFRPIDSRIQNKQDPNSPQFFTESKPSYTSDVVKNQESPVSTRLQAPFEASEGIRNQGVITFSSIQTQFNPLYSTDSARYRENSNFLSPPTQLNLLFSPVERKNPGMPSFPEHPTQLNLLQLHNGSSNQAFPSVSKQQNYLNSLERIGVDKNPTLFTPSKQQMEFNLLNSVTSNRNSEITRLHKVPVQHTSTGNNPYEHKELEIFKNANILAVPITTKFLPLPLKESDGPKYRDDETLSRYYYDGVERNISGNLETDPRRIATTGGGHFFRSDSQDTSPFRINDVTIKRNSTDPLKSTVTLPFHAFITITGHDPDEQTTTRNERKEYYTLPIRDPPDDFPPYFQKNFTTSNEFGKISVVLDQSEMNTESNQDIDKKTDTKKRQSILSQLLSVLGLKRGEGSKNNTDIIATPPVLKLLKGPSSQKIQVPLESKATQGRGRRNETANQENEQQGLDEESENQEDGGGEEQGSLQAILELLPLITPILEDISDPQSDVDLSELINAAVPLLEGLSEGDDETPPVDSAAILGPILTRLLQGPDGQGIDSAAVLPPIITLVAPVIGGLIGPLSGPLSRQLSNPGQGSDFSAIVQSIAAPLSTPTGYGKMSPFSNLVAGIVASLSKELTAGGSDIGALVSAVVSGVLTGASAGIKGSFKGQKDNAYSPTSYGTYGSNTGNKGGNPGYGGYGAPPVPAYTVNPIQLIGTSIKDVLTAGTKALSSVVGAITGIIGASSKDPGYTPYGPPPTYGAPSTTRSPYTAAGALRPPPPPPPRQIRPQRQKI